MVRLSLWQIGQLVSYVKTLFNLNIIRHIKLHYSIRLTFQNLQRANMSSPKHACGGTCRLDSQLLTASTVHTKLHLSSSCSSNRLLKKWCVDDTTVAIRHKIVIRFLNYTHQTQTKHTQSPANSHVLNKTRLRRHMLIRFPIPTVSTFSSKRSLSNSCSSGKVKSRSIFIQHPSTSHPVAHSMEQFIPPFNQNRLPKEWWRTWR